MNKKKTLHLIAAVAVFVLVKLLLSSGSGMGLTDKGASVLALFTATIYTWITVGCGWTSLVAVGLIALTGIITPAQAWQFSLGNATTVLTILICILSYALNATNIGKTVAIWFITRKAAERIAAAGKELAEFNSSKGAVAKKMRTEYGVPTLFGPGILNTVEELFMGSILGIKDMSVCMRRYADLFEDFITQMSVSWKKEVAGRMDACPNDGESVFQFNTPNLAHTIMNPKQFGRYYWPQMKWR